MVRITASIIFMMFLMIIGFGLIMPLNHVFSDTVNMKVQLDCIDSLTGKYKASVRLVNHLNSKDLKNGEKKSKTLDFDKILAKDDDDFNTYTVTVGKFKKVKEGDGFQAESKSLEHKYSQRESIRYFRPGNWAPPNTILFKVDTHRCHIND